MDFTISMELAGKLAGQSPEQLQAALFEGDGDEKKLKDNAEETFRNFVFDKFKDAERDKVKGEVGRAIRERMENLEKAVKPLFDKFEINAERIEDGLSALSEKIPGQSSKDGKPQELTPDQIKKLPAYQKLLDEELSHANQKAQEWETKYNDYLKTSETEKVVNASTVNAISLLEGMGANWSTDKAKQVKNLFKVHGTDLLGLDDDKNTVLRDQDGNPYRDETTKNKITFKDWLSEKWKDMGYTFHEAPAGSGSAGAKRGQQANGSTSIVINSKEHFEELMNANRGNHEKRSEIRQAWAEQLKEQP